MSAGLTPSQTVGPFFHVALVRPDTWRLVSEENPAAVCIEGVVLDGDSKPVPDALIEIWQATPDGRYPGANDSDPVEPEFSGFGRCATDEGGHFRFVTIKPGRVPGPRGGHQAPHLDVSLFARGLLKRLVTRIYFPDEPDANASDPVLNAVPRESRKTLIARPTEGGLRFDIKLQGDDESVFFDV